MIKLIRSERVTPTETHFEIDVNGKNVQVAKWVDMEWFTDYEIFNGEDLITDDERDAVQEFIEEQPV
jgi:hypothetical protein